MDWLRVLWQAGVFISLQLFELFKCMISSAVVTRLLTHTFIAIMLFVECDPHRL